MKEIGVLMKPDMALAAREDRKTQTRRIITPQPEYITDNTVMVDDLTMSIGLFIKTKCPYGKPGTILWIREVHYSFGCWQKNGISEKTGRQKWKFLPHGFVPKAESIKFPDDPPKDLLRTGMSSAFGWYKRNSLFMPRSAARTLLEITNIRVERLQDISEEDCQAEGIGQAGYETGGITESSAPIEKGSYILAFMELWERINGPGSWGKNYWVWVIEFKRL